jgi:hypothetical protein
MNSFHALKTVTLISVSPAHPGLRRWGQRPDDHRRGCHRGGVGFHGHDQGLHDGRNSHYIQGLQRLPSWRIALWRQFNAAPFTRCGVRRLESWHEWGLHRESLVHPLQCRRYPGRHAKGHALPGPGRRRECVFGNAHVADNQSRRCCRCAGMRKRDGSARNVVNLSGGA